MAKIHWLAYVIVGLVVSIISWKFNYQKLIFFFYIGLIFILVGIVKLIFNLMKKEKKAEHKTQQINQQAHHIKYCTQCGNQLRTHDRFCSRCGRRN